MLVTCLKRMLFVVVSLVTDVNKSMIVFIDHSKVCDIILVRFFKAEQILVPR